MRKLLLLVSVFPLLVGYAALRLDNLSAGEINASSKRRSIGDKLDTPMVVVNVLVMDSHNKPIPDLTHEDFTIAEDDVQQQKAFFVGPDSPVNFSLAFDISSSEPLKLMAGQVAKDFVRQIRSTDDVAIPQLKITREVVRDFATDKKKLEGALSKISSNNKSPLFDVIAEAINSTKEKRQAPREGVIVIIDGHSSSGTAFDREGAYAILRENTPIYFIILDDGRYGSHPANQSRNRQTRNLLIRIAEVSGGQAVVVKNTNDISVATEQIIRRVNNLYTLGYYPTNEKYDGSFRYIRVRVTPKDKRKVRVFAPLGYYAPGPEQIREVKINDK